MAVPRETPYIWATWLPRLLTGENSCEWAVWFKAHRSGGQGPDNHEHRGERAGSARYWHFGHRTPEYLARAGNVQHGAINALKTNTNRMTLSQLAARYSQVLTCTDECGNEKVYSAAQPQRTGRLKQPGQRPGSPAVDISTSRPAPINFVQHSKEPVTDRPAERK